MKKLILSEISYAVFEMPSNDLLYVRQIDRRIYAQCSLLGTLRWDKSFSSISDLEKYLTANRCRYIGREAI